MKAILMTLTLIISTVSFAGNGSGTLGTAAKRLAELSRTSQEVVYHIEEKNGLVIFEYGFRNGQTWEIQKIEISEQDVEAQLDLLKALDQSKLDKNWARIE